MSIRFAVLLLGAVLILSGVAEAHGAEDGPSFELENNGYLVDVGYNTDMFVDDESVLFQFDLLNKEGARQKFHDVWVRIVSDRQTAFAGGVSNSDFGGARITYVFPNPGTYTLSVRYQTKDGDALSEASFPITVVSGGWGDASSSDGGPVTKAILWAVIGLLLGVAGMFFLRKR
ncbi:MAG: hypothetical protein AAB421_05645 [Patescibacteria group bacterium]